MKLETNIDVFSEPSRESIEMIYEDNLLDLAKQFKFSEFTYFTLFEICKNKEFKDNLYNYCVSRLNLDLDQIDFYFNSNFSLDSESIRRLISKQQDRLEMVCIEFMYMNLPFNYLIKLNKMNKLGKLYSRDLYPIDEIRDGLIKLLNLEIEKIMNVDITMDKIKSQLVNKKQSDKVGAIQTASQSISKKTILENKFIISVLDTIPSDKLESLIIDILDDSLIQSNMI